MTDWIVTPDEKYQSAETESVPFSELLDLECRLCGYRVEMVLLAEDFRPRWSADCPECGAHYSASPTEVKITQSEGGL